MAVKWDVQRPRGIAAGSTQHLELVRAPLIRQIEDLTTENAQLRTDLELYKQLRTEARDAGAFASKRLVELERRIKDMEGDTFEIWRLNGYIQALRDTGAIPQLPDVIQVKNNVL